MRHRDTESRAPRWPASSVGRRVVQEHLLGELRAPRSAAADRTDPNDHDPDESGQGGGQTA